MKKGFTLLEMSLVLVIIGLLMGLVIKGKSLIDSAKYTKEWNIMRDIGLGLDSYAVNNDGELHGARVGNFIVIDIKKFMDFTGMQENDFKSNIFNDTYYTPIIVSVTSRGDYFYGEPTTDMEEGDNVTIANSTATPGVYATKTIFFTDEQMSQSVAVTGLCRLERSFDDKNFFNGILRFFDSEIGNFMTVDDDCSVYDDTSEYPVKNFAASFI